MSSYIQIIEDTVNDLQALKRLIKGDHIRDDHTLASILTLGDDLRTKALAEAVKVVSQAPLFPN